MTYSLHTQVHMPSRPLGSLLSNQPSAHPSQSVRFPSLFFQLRPGPDLWPGLTHHPGRVPRALSHKHTFTSVVPLTADGPTGKKCSYGSRVLESCWSSLPFNLRIRSITTPSRAYFLNGFEPCLFLSVLSPTTSVLASLSFILTMTLPPSVPHHSLPSPPQPSHSAKRQQNIGVKSLVLKTENPLPAPPAGVTLGKFVSPSGTDKGHCEVKVYKLQLAPNNVRHCYAYLSQMQIWYVTAPEIISDCLIL